MNPISRSTPTTCAALRVRRGRHAVPRVAAGAAQAPPRGRLAPTLGAPPTPAAALAAAAQTWLATLASRVDGRDARQLTATADDYEAADVRAAQRLPGRPLTTVSAEVTYPRLRATDPARWRGRRCLAALGRDRPDTGPPSCAGHVARLRHRLVRRGGDRRDRPLAGLQPRAGSVPAALLAGRPGAQRVRGGADRARTLLTRAVAAARRAGLVIDDRRHGARDAGPDPAAPFGRHRPPPTGRG